MAAALLDLAAASELRISVILEEQAADAATRVLFSIAQQLDDPALPARWKDTLRPWLNSPTLSTDPARLRERIASPAKVRELARSTGMRSPFGRRCARVKWGQVKWSEMGSG